MSFSQEVKRELCAVEILEDCDALGECYGILLFANLFRQNGVRVITGNEDLARRVERLFLRAFGLRVEPRRGSKEGRYVFEITKKQEMNWEDILFIKAHRKVILMNFFCKSMT